MKFDSLLQVTVYPQNGISHFPRRRKEGCLAAVRLRRPLRGQLEGDTHNDSLKFVGPVVKCIELMMKSPLKS